MSPPDIATPPPPAAALPPVAVTGASGWIATRLCAVADARGVPVRPIERAALESDEACAVALAGCHAVVHLAAIAHRPEGTVGEAAYREANVELTMRVARAAALAGVDRVVLASTAKVAGERTDRPARETDPPAPGDAYARSKLEAEQALAGPGAHWPFETVILRPPLVYGPGVRANYLALLRLADSGWPLPLGGARAKRSMVFVDNLVDALLFACEAPALAGGTFYVADDADVDVASLLRALRSRLGRRAPVFAMPRGVVAAAARLAALPGREVSPTLGRLFEPLMVDASALRAAGWRAPVTPDAALDATVHWYLGQARA